MRMSLLSRFLSQKSYVLTNVHDCVPLLRYYLHCIL